jgi:ribosomal protein S18 acetylase RimI-like enzyme
VRLRAARAEDADAVTEVFLASRAAAMPYLPRLHSDEATHAWITHVVLPGTRVWLAEEDGTEAVLGFAALDGRLLDHLYLRPEVRRRGIGTLLLDAVKAASPEELSLHVFQRNTEARSFYERHGFVVVDTDDGSRNEENEPDMTYRWTP